MDTFFAIVFCLAFVYFVALTVTIGTKVIWNKLFPPSRRDY